MVLPSTIFELALLVASLASSGVMVALLPRTWREFRWACKFGDDDECRIGRSVWYSHLAGLTGSVSFAGIAARWFALPGRRGWIVITLASVAFAASAMTLYAQIHLVPRGIRKAQQQGTRKLPLDGEDGNRASNDH